MSGVFDGFLGAVVGGLIGGLVTGGAQLWSFHRGKQVARAELGRRAAVDLLDDVHFCDEELTKLPYTSHVAGSPLSFEDRQQNAEPMLTRLRHSESVYVPQLTDPVLRQRLVTFRKECEWVASPNVDDSQLSDNLEKARGYGRYVQECLAAYLAEKPFPVTEPTPIHGP
jgi:hypothetical protein